MLLDNLYLIARKRENKIEFWTENGLGYACDEKHIGLFNLEEINYWNRQACVHVCMNVKDLNKAFTRYDYVAFNLSDYMFNKINGGDC